MSGSRSTVFAGIISLTSICAALFMSANAQGQHNPYDDDKYLEFYWDAPSGNGNNYNVYLSIDGADYFMVETITTTPTEQDPYIVPRDAEDGKEYRLQVEAVETGYMSEPSDLVLCKLRSPGDKDGLGPADANKNSRVGSGDWAILSNAWKTQRGDASFNYKADFNYDDFVNILDFSVFGSNLGNRYNRGTGAPRSFLPVASGGKCKIKLIGPENIGVGDKISIDIVIEEAEDIYAMDFEVSFDPAVVKVEEIKQGTFFSTAVDDPEEVSGLRQAGVGLKATPEPPSWIAGKISQGHGRISPTLAAVPLGSSTGRSGNGIIATLKFAAMSGGVSSISLKNIHAYNSKLDAITVTPIGATLTTEAAKYHLAQNYPNPFNPETWIPYALAEERDRVTIIIYSVLGEEIRRLDLGHRNAGFYTTKDRAAYWDGKNEDGISAASGVYFYQIKAGDFSAVRKMVVLR